MPSEKQHKYQQMAYPTAHMVRATKGTYIKTEMSIKEIIMLINETDNMVIEEINDDAVFIQPGRVDELKTRVENILSNVYKRIE